MLTKAVGAPLVGALMGRESACKQGTHKGCPYSPSRLLGTLSTWFQPLCSCPDGMRLATDGWALDQYEIIVERTESLLGRHNMVLVGNLERDYLGVAFLGIG